MNLSFGSFVRTLSFLVLRPFLFLGYFPRTNSPKDNTHWLHVEVYPEIFLDTPYSKVYKGDFPLSDVGKMSKNKGSPILNDLRPVLNPQGTWTSHVSLVDGWCRRRL